MTALRARELYRFYRAGEEETLALRGVSVGVPVSAAMMTQFATLTPDAHIEEAIQTLLRTSQNEFPVVDPAGKLVGLLDPDPRIAVVGRSVIASFCGTGQAAASHAKPGDCANNIGSSRKR